MATERSSHVSHNYHRESEIAINQQANLELYVSYTYLSMAYHFDRDDVALKNFSAYFLKLSHKLSQHVETLLGLQNQRGGQILLSDISKPDKDDWGSALHAMEQAFHLEQRMGQSFLHLHQQAIDHEDSLLCEFFASHFMLQQVRTVGEMCSHVINLRKMEAQDPRLADYLLDSLDESDKGNCPTALV